MILPWDIKKSLNQVKNMKIRILFFFLSISTILAAQDYTYITDRRFNSPEELVGYKFRPNHMEIPNDYDEALGKGECSFFISANNLYVEGNENIKGVYNINNINTTEYGFLLTLMNPRNPAEQGQLKVISTPQRWVEALIFKRAKKEPETIFFLPIISDKKRNKEEAYFTDRWEFEIESSDELWGEAVQPFLAINGNGIQNRFTSKDSTRIKFIEKVTIVEKEIKRGKKSKKEKMSNVELGIPDEELEEMEIEEEIEIEAEPEPEVEEEEEEETAPRRRHAMNYPGSGNAYPGSDDEEEEEEEEEVVEIVEAEKEETIEEEIEPIEETTSDETKPNVKVKTIKEYFVEVSYAVKDEHGATEIVSKLFPVKKVTEREDENAGPKEDRYQLEFALKKGNPIYIYLTGKRTISSVEIGEETFLMRGH